MDPERLAGGLADHGGEHGQRVHDQLHGVLGHGGLIVPCHRDVPGVQGVLAEAHLGEVPQPALAAEEREPPVFPGRRVQGAETVQERAVGGDAVLRLVLRALAVPPAPDFLVLARPGGVLAAQPGVQQQVEDLGA